MGEGGEEGVGWAPRGLTPLLSMMLEARGPPQPIAYSGSECRAGDEAKWL